MEFKQYPSYKKSGVEWLGNVPEHWQIVRTKDIFNHRKEEALEDDEIVTAFRDGQVTLRKNRRTDGFTNSIKEHGYQHINNGDLVIHEMDAFAGAIGVSDSSGKSTPVYTVCYAKNENINHHFYSHFFRTMAKTGFINSLAKGIRVRSTEFRWNESRNVYLAEPPKADQEKIVSFLDTETARIDNLIAKQEKLIELLEEQRKSIISHAVTKGLNPNAPMKDSGVEWLGDVPEHWRISSLKRYGYFKGGAGFPHAYQGNTEENIPFFKVNSLSKDKRFLSSFSDFVGEETAKKLGAKIFPKNSIFFAKVGAALLLERIRTNQQPCCIDNNMMGFVIQNELSFDFAFYLMSLIDFKYLVNPGAVPSINESQISSFLISVPPISEQTQIANYLDTETARIDNLIAKQKNLIEKLKEYRSSIISHAVTGKIDIREFGA